MRRDGLRRGPTGPFSVEKILFQEAWNVPDEQDYAGLVLSQAMPGHRFRIVGMRTI